MTPEVRLSPDGKTVAVRKEVPFGREWDGTDARRYFDEDVADWVPLYLPPSHALKQRYRIVFTSDDHRSEVDMYLTEVALAVLVSLAAAVNKQAKWSVDVRMNIEPSAAKGEVA